MLNGLDPQSALGQEIIKLKKRVDHLESLPLPNPVTPIYPTRATLWVGHATVLTGSAMSSAFVTSGQIYNIRFFQNPGGNGDSFTLGFFLAAGSYTFSVIGETSTDRAKLDWYVDDVLQTSGQDWYSASTVANVIKTASITVVGNGNHVLKCLVNGKNASSSAYFNALTQLWIKPTNDTVETD